MARMIKPLTATEIKNAKPKDKDYKLFDGDGLYLFITKSGSKKWRLKYTFEGKEKTLSFGDIKDIPLSRARELKIEYRQKIKNGINPSEEKQKVKNKIKLNDLKKNHTVKILLTELLNEQLQKQDISEPHHKRTLLSYKNDVFPIYENHNISDIDVDDIKTIISKVSERGAVESSRKLYYALNKAFKILVTRNNSKEENKNYGLKFNPCSQISINELVGQKSTKNYPTITDDKGIKALLLNIDEYMGDFTTKQALRMLPYVFVRPYNIRYAEWSEIDFKLKQWNIPAKKMKTKADLIVPLTDSVIKILNEIKPFSGDGQYIFPSLKNKNSPMSDNTLLGAIRRLGYSKDEFVPHGFRAMFSTIAHEKSKYKHDIIETQLAHSVGSSVSKAYNRAEYLEDRVNLMQWWSNYLDKLKKD